MVTALFRSLTIALLALNVPLLIAQATLKPVTSTAPDPNPFLSEKKVAIVVGISDYPEESGFPKLQFAAKDAQDLAAALEKQGYKTQLLTNEHAMKSSIQRALQQARIELNQGKIGDRPLGTVLFAFSGHGGQKGTGMDAKQYLVTFDSDAEAGDFGYPLKDIAEALNDSGAERKMMFIDACRDLEGGSKSVPSLATFRDLSSSQGIKTFFSTAPGAQSYEDEKSQHGYFTKYLLQGLSGQAAAPDGLITFDGLAAWVIRTMKADGTYQVPYWNQSASGDFYLAGSLSRKAALVIGVDRYSANALHSAIAGAKQVNAQLDASGFDTTYLEDPTYADLLVQIKAFAKNIGPSDAALFYFAGEGGVANGKPFVMAEDGKLPDHVVGGKWDAVPANAIALADIIDLIRKNHPGPNVFLLDMGLARASSADTLDLVSLKRDHTLVLFSCKTGQDPERDANGTLFSRTFVSVLKEPGMSAGYAAAKIKAAIFEQTNGVQYAVDVPMLPDRVYLTPSQ
ncbi:MAG TPA: caspase family protein [Verrucomicrobiae bacterium]|jgi:uncharacterized caspase-like protein|nr:caspase family protein [Verrucomicrobiae bacterium]